MRLRECERLFGGEKSMSFFLLLALDAFLQSFGWYWRRVPFLFYNLFFIFCFYFFKWKKSDLLEKILRAAYVALCSDTSQKRHWVYFILMVHKVQNIFLVRYSNIELYQKVAIFSYN